MTVLTPTEAVQEIINVVMGLNAQAGIVNSLDKKLEAVQDALDNANGGNVAAAINKLEAFINEIEAQRGNQLSNEDADLLISMAQAVIAALSS